MPWLILLPEAPLLINLLPFRTYISFGLPPVWAAMEILSPSRAPSSPAWKMFCLGAIPGLPKVHLHNPVLAYEDGDDFMKFFYQAEQGSWILSCSSWKARSPTKKIKKEGYWAASVPIRIPASPSPPATGSTAWRRRRWQSSASGPAPLMAGSMPWQAILPAAWGSLTILGGIGVRRPGLPIVNVPGCPVQPDNFMETVLYLLYQVAGRRR